MILQATCRLLFLLHLNFNFKSICGPDIGKCATTKLKLSLGLGRELKRKRKCCWNCRLTCVSSVCYWVMKINEIVPKKCVWLKIESSNICETCLESQKGIRRKCLKKIIRLMNGKIGGQKCRQFKYLKYLLENVLLDNSPLFYKI